jgi:hypothetical protein
MQIIHTIIQILTIATGILAILRPKIMADFTGLQLTRGLVEMQSGIGALFIALGAAPWILSHPIAYQMLGIAYLGIAAARFPAMMVHNSFEKTNWISLAIEIIFGVLLLIPLYPVL